MIQDLKGFQLDLANFGKYITQENHPAVCKKLAFMVLQGVVMMNPVRTGHSRGNWSVTLSNPSVGEMRHQDPINDGLAAMAAVKPFPLIWVSNNVPYIIPLENGSSKQAPQGMVSVTLASIQGWMNSV